MFVKSMDTTLSSSLNGGDLDSTSSGGASSDNSTINQDNMHSPISYGALFLPNSGELYYVKGKKMSKTFSKAV